MGDVYLMRLADVAKTTVASGSFLKWDGKLFVGEANVALTSAANTFTAQPQTLTKELRINYDGAMAGNIQPMVFTVLADEWNGAASALYIHPLTTSNAVRLWFGKSGRTFYAANFTYVGTLENFPARVDFKANQSDYHYGNSTLCAVLACAGAGNDIIIAPGSAVSPGFITANKNTAGMAMLRSIRFKTFANSADAPASGAPEAGYVFDTNALGTLLHSVWKEAGVAKARMRGGQMFSAAPNAAPADADIPAGGFAAYLDEAGGLLKFRVKYADGVTLKTGSIAIA